MTVYKLSVVIQMKTRAPRIFIHHKNTIRRSNCRCQGKICGLGMVVCGCLYFCIICLVFILILFLSPKSCTSDLDCKTEYPCSIETCEKNVCHYQKKEKCCTRDADCGTSQCYTSFCDHFTHKCNAIPVNNGTRCSDNDYCTIEDQCYNGQCQGKTLLCQNTNQCIRGSCMQTQGCVFENNDNGLSCNDNNACTLNDKCSNGICAAMPKDCSHLDTLCSIGACDIVTGECVRFARNEGGACDDGLQCTVFDKCSNGICSGSEDQCFDNNPCTINTCSEQTGCVIQYQSVIGQCIPGCTALEDCPLTYTCYDGTCIKTPDAKKQHIAMIGYEVEQCQQQNSSRLIQHFVLDSQTVNINGEIRYRIVKDPDDIITNDAFAPLGFGDEIIHLASNSFGSDIARTTFSIATECQTFTIENCATLFSNREYRFYAYTHDCLSINGLTEGCIAMNHVLEASISLSLSTCTQFPGYTSTLYPRGRAVVYYRDEFYRDEYNWLLRGPIERGFIGIETTSTSDIVIPMITDLKICQGDEDNHLGGCVDGTNRTECFNIGCFGWNENNSPLSFEVDIIKDSVVTALALSDSFLASGCYDNDDYNMGSVCSLTKCDVYGMDDFFEFNFKELTGKRNYVFDIKYKYNYCSRRRLLGQEEYEYAQAIIKLN